MLFEPYKINSMTLPNRIVLPAMVTRLSGEDGFVNKDIHDRYIRFAKGEVGLIVVEAMAIHTAKSGPLLRLSDDKFIPGLRDLAKEIHEISPSKVVPQIIHFLKVARSGWRQKVQDLSIADIKQIVKEYGEAAYRSAECGFDGVELHMAHAYTVSSFLSRKNTRRDEYGGKSIENRMRLMCEVYEEVRRSVGKDFPVGVRFVGEEGIKGGYSTEDSKIIALKMAQLGFDYISVSAGGKFEDAIKKEGEPPYPYTGYSGDKCMPGSQYPDAYNIYLPETIKKYVNANGYNTPIVGAGKISKSSTAEEILAKGQADLIGMARALLADPDLPKKIREGREDKVVECIYWNICKGLDEAFKKVTCGLWPKGAVQAPESSDESIPEWETDGKLKAEIKNSSIHLKWETATDDEEVMGYDVFRSENGLDYERIYAVKRPSYQDNTAFSGNSYSYFVRAYDIAGNKSVKSNVAEIKF